MEIEGKGRIIVMGNPDANVMNVESNVHETHMR